MMVQAVWSACLESGNFCPCGEMIVFSRTKTNASTVADPLHNDHPWYAIHVRSKFENLTSTALCGKGYEVFLPLYRSRRRWSDRVRKLDLPLFPGYLFCRLDVHDRLLPILTTPGVVAIVGAGKVPIPVFDEEIATIRAVLGSGLAAQPCPFLNLGTGVYIERGPLAGIEGIVTNLDKKYRLVISVTLLQQSVTVEIDREWVRPIVSPGAPHAVILAERPRVSKALADRKSTRLNSSHANISYAVFC